MLRDRGNIKWTAMMLPEHVAMLRKLKESNSYKTRPTLDEQEIFRLNQMIATAIEEKKEVQIKYFDQHDYNTFNGSIKRLDGCLQSLHLVNNNSEKLELKLENIINVKIQE